MRWVLPIRAGADRAATPMRPWPLVPPQWLWPSAGLSIAFVAVFWPLSCRDVGHSYRRPRPAIGPCGGRWRWPRHASAGAMPWPRSGRPVAVQWPCRRRAVAGVGAGRASHRVHCHPTVRPGHPWDRALGVQNGGRCLSPAQTRLAADGRRSGASTRLVRVGGVAESVRPGSPILKVACEDPSRSMPTLSHVIALARVWSKPNGSVPRRAAWSHRWWPRFPA